MMKISTSAWRRFGLGLLGALLLGGAAFVMLRAGPLAPVKVTVSAAAKGAVQPTLFGIGTVEARRAYLIGPTAAGRVSRVLVDVGDAVRAGQVLAEMDPVDLDERIAALGATQARGASLVAASQAQWRDAQSRQSLAEVNARRYVDLGQKDFISAGGVEAKLQEKASADALVAAAQSGLDAARQDLPRLAAEQAALRQQRAKLRLLAPADGVVSAREAEPGSTVVAGQAVVRLVDPASLWVRVRLDQARSAGLAVGLPASVALRSRPRHPLPGTVARVEVIGDSVTEERAAQVSFDRRPDDVAIGELAEVTLKLPPSAPGVVVPAASIRRRGDGLGVWRLKGGRPVFVPVVVGQAGASGDVQVLDGLAAGDEVVVHSERELAEGSRVSVVAAIAGARP